MQTGASRILSLAEAAAAIAAIAGGGCVIYPTETLYGLGAAMDNETALSRIVAVKGRPEGKPLPLILGDFEQIWDVLAEGFRQGPLFEDFSRLARRFWPGSLSLVLPGKSGLSSLITDAQGMTSVRLTPHPLAAALCRLAKSPIAATSANKSGQPAPRVPDEIDPGLAARTDGVLAEKPWPGGGAPSTVAALLGGGRLSLIRHGAVPARVLAEAGFSVEERGR